MKSAWKAKHPEFEELYAKRESDPEAEKQFVKLYLEFLETMGTWYRDGKWNETTREIVEKMVERAG
jgi:hypothetical protein